MLGPLEYSRGKRIGQKAVCQTVSDCLPLQSKENTDEVDKLEYADKNLACLRMPGIPIVSERQKTTLQTPCEILEFGGIC